MTFLLFWCILLLKLLKPFFFIWSFLEYLLGFIIGDYAETEQG